MSLAALKVMKRVRAADRNGALALASAYLAQNERHPLILMLAAERWEGQGFHLDALALLKEAVAAERNEPELWRRYGVALGRQGLHEESRKALERALDLAPEEPAILLGCGVACFITGDLGAAERYYQEAAQLLPGAAEPPAALAAVAAARLDHDRAAEYAKRALALDASNVTARIALVRAELNSGRPDIAMRRASAMIDELGPHSEHRLALLGLRADARDAMNESAGAFADYCARNHLLVKQYAPLMEKLKAERRIDQARRVEAYFKEASPDDWRPTTSAEAQPAAPCTAHLFLVGFPRSGTTLLEKALSGHDAVATLPEIDCLGDTAGAFLDNDEGLDALAKLDARQVAHLRERYFRHVAESIGEVSNRVLVDKMPLHSVALPVIAKLFPEARIVFSLRDPRDVVLSCFRRRFQMNVAMHDMLTLSGAAQFYDAVMRLVESCRAVIPIRLHEVRHERLVSHFEEEVTRVLALADLTWSDDVRHFAGRAAANARTPSDHQLQKGLNSEGVGTWRRYAEYLKPVTPLLQPWVRHWGYEA